MALNSLCAALGATLLLASPALAAVTITNQDTQSHTLTVNLGTSQSEHAIAAGKSLQFECPDGCGFHNEANGFSRVADGDSKLVIDKNAELRAENGHGDMTMPDGSD